MSIKINDNRNSSDVVVKSGDIVILDGSEYYLGRCTDYATKIVFFSLQNQNGVWDSNGVMIENGIITKEKIKKHFSDRNIEIISRDDYEMIINIGGTK